MCHSKADFPRPALIGSLAALVAGAVAVSRAADAPRLALPTPQQVAWHDMEIEVLLCLDPCTWQNRQRGNHSTI